MMMIVAHHFVVHGDFDYPPGVIDEEKLWTQFLKIGGKIGVDIFCLITGYFSVKKECIELKKIARIWIQICFYSILFYLIAIWTGLESLSVSSLIKHALPIMTEQWWFSSTFFVLYICSPYLNQMLNNLSENAYITMLLVFGICWCLVPTITGEKFQSNNLLWFVYVYSLAGYIRLYRKEEARRKGILLAMAVLILVMTFLLNTIFDILSIKRPIESETGDFFYDMQSLPIISIALLLFLWMKNVKINNGGNIINRIASATFGVYLIHDNEYMRTILWKYIFKNATYSESSILIPYSIIVIGLVFVFCTMIELMRMYILEKLYMPLIDVIAKKIKVCENHILKNAR